MSLVMPKEGGDFELVPAGSFIATCYRVIDLGTQQYEYQGVTKRSKKLMISWELTEEKMKDGRPFSIHKNYNLSSSKKATLRIDLEAWRGVPFTEADFGSFDVSKLLGKSCFIGVVHTKSGDNQYANISSILRLPKGMDALPLVNDKVQFDLDDFDQMIYDSLSESLRAKIAKSPEYQELKGGHVGEPNTVNDSGHEPNHPAFDSDIPF